MVEAKGLIETLKRRLSAKEEQLEEIEDKNSDEALMIAAEIEELKALIEAYEKIIDMLEHKEIKTSEEQAKFDETVSEMVSQLKDYNEGYAESRVIIDRTTELERAIDELAQTDASENVASNEQDANRIDNPEKNAVEPTPETSAIQNGTEPTQNQVEPTKGSDVKYQDVMNNRISKLKTKIEKLKRRPDLTGRRAEKIRGFEIEIEALKKEAANHKDRTKLSPEIEERLSEMDLIHDVNKAQLKEYADEIETLKEIRKELTSKKDIRQMRKLLKKLESKNSDLKIKDKSLTDIEGEMLARGYKDEMKARAKAARAEGIVSANEDSLAVNNELREMLDPENKVIDRIQDRIYDIKGAHYRKRIEKGQERLKELQSGKVPIKLNGARVTSATREYLEGLRNRRQVQLHTSDSMQMTA